MLYKILLLVIFCILSFCSVINSQTLQWRTLPNSPSVGFGQRLEDIYFINNNTGWAIHYLGKVYRTTNGGGTWDTAIVPSQNYLRSIGFFDSENGILGTLDEDSSKILYRTSNHGVNWSLITNLPSPWPLGICGINIVNENVAYACGRFRKPARIVKTTDKGLTWTASLIDTSLATSLVDCFFWDENNGIAVGGQAHMLSFVASNAVVLKTTNGGNTWSRVYIATQLGQFWKISARATNTVFLSTESYSSGVSDILKSTNFGNDWTAIPFRQFQQQGIGFINENTGWVGGIGPNYETTNGGGEWHLAGWGNLMNRVRFINDTIAYAVGTRIYKYSRETVGINLISEKIPSYFSLHQNYPNPFNPVTKIKIDIPSNVNRQTSDVKLVVYDALGKEVITIMNDQLSPGSYEVEFDGSNLPSGIYFYKIQMENFFEVKRMILLK